MALFQVPDRPFAGYIFDCDGTLADSMPLHFQAWCDTLESFHPGLVFNEDLYYSWAGVSTPGVVERLNEIHGIRLDPTEVAHRKEDCYLQRMQSVQPIHEVAHFARTMSRTHPVSVATGGWRRVAGETLRLVGLGDVFSIIVTPEDVVHGKPAPDMFLLAAEKMGVDPRDCLVFEDGIPGIEGARAAGMEVVVIPSRLR